MKTDNALHTLLASGAHRPSARAGSSQDAGGDPFAQMLAELQAQTGAEDAQSLPGKGRVQAGQGDATVEAADDAALLTPAVADDLTESLTPSEDEPRAPADATPLSLTVAVAAQPMLTEGQTLTNTRGPVEEGPRVDSPSLSENAQETLASGGEWTSAPLTERQAPGAKSADKPATPAPVATSMAPATPPGEWISTLARAKPRPVAAAARAGIEGLAEARRPGDGEDRRGGRVAHGRAAMVEPSLTAASVLATNAPGAAADARLGGPRDEAVGDSRGAGPAAAAPGDATGQSATGPADGTDFGLHLGQALGETFEAIGAQISLWAAGKSQRASFSVEDGLDDPLAVELTLNDGVAQLAFRTDDSSMRQLLQAQAPTALADALTRAGLTLGGFSVGSQGSHEGQQRDTSGKEGRGTTTRVSLTPAADRPDAVGLARARAGHASGAAGLDVYA